MWRSPPASPSLRPFVEALRVSEGRHATARTRALPPGAALVAFSLGAEPFRVLEADDGSRG